MAVPDLQDAIDHLQDKNLDAAIATLERKIEELPAHLTAHVLLARAYETKHQWRRALKAWENVHFLMPNSPVGKKGKARVLRQLNRHEEAREAAPSRPDEPSSASETTSEDEATLEKDAADSEEDEGPPTTDTEAVSELEQLRRQAEKEARRGGARPELTENAASSRSGTDAESEESPETRVGQLEDEDENLDRLIDELESAQIEPDPDVDDVPPPDLENDIDDLVSETLARIHEGQGEYRKAAQIYMKLASQEPDQAREYLEKAAEMREEAEAAAQQGNGS